MSEANKAVVRRFVEEIQTKHNLAVAGELFDPNGVNHSPVPGLPPGLSMLEEFEIFFGLILTAFPDIRAEIHTQVAEGDKVVTHKSFRATHQGDFMGIPATGKAVEFDVIDIFRVADGKMTDHWAVGDMMGLMQQLGAVPPSGG